MSDIPTIMVYSSLSNELITLVLYLRELQTHSVKAT